MDDSPGARTICAIRKVLTLHFKKGSRRARDALANEIAWFNRWRLEATDDSTPVNSTEMLLMEHMIGAAGKGYDLLHNLQKTGRGEYSNAYRKFAQAVVGEIQQRDPDFQPTPEIADPAEAPPSDTVVTEAAAKAGQVAVAAAAAAAAAADDPASPSPLPPSFASH